MIVSSVAGAPTLALQMIGTAHAQGPPVACDFRCIPGLSQSLLHSHASNLVLVGCEDDTDLRISLLSLGVLGGPWCL